MRVRFLVSVCLAICVSVAARAAACPPATSVSLAINQTYTFGGATTASAIVPDSTGAAYTDGVNGVSAAINGCTHDAVIDLGKSARTVGFSLQTPVATNSYTPSWTGMPFSAKPHMVVSNIMYAYNASAYYQFTTTAQFSFTAPDGSNDQLQFVNPTAQASSVNGSLINQPYYTSLVVVTHTPAGTNGSVETWTITPDNTNMNPSGTPAATQVGGLLTPLGRNNTVNAGQFSVPFQFTITRK